MRCPVCRQFVRVIDSQRNQVAWLAPHVIAKGSSVVCPGSNGSVPKRRRIKLADRTRLGRRQRRQIAAY